MHDCPDCGQACYCDLEDVDVGEFDDCVHECDESDEDDDAYDGSFTDEWPNNLRPLRF